MTHSLDTLRRRAKNLRKAYESGDPIALQRLKVHPPRASGELRHADFLHVIAQEEGFASWPALKTAADTQGLSRAQQLQRLKMALFHGQLGVVERLLSDTPDLADGHFGLQVALLNLPAVEQMLAEDSSLATTELGPRRPILHLAFSRYLRAKPARRDDMLTIAERLLEHGADVNDSYPVSPDNDHPLSALYGAIGHADNMVLGRWLLEHGANPNDGESLYHATELGHHDGLKMLLEFGARPAGTNAVLRAMDFNDHEAVEMLLAAGADPNEYHGDPVGGEMPWVIPALHQAARRMCDQRMITLLLDAGADPTRSFEGVSVYACARVFGNTALSDALEARYSGEDSESRQALHLSEDEQLLATAADGGVSDRYINPDKLPETFRNMIRTILHLPGKLPHVQRLVALGLEYDRPDSEGLTAVQAAGWEGLPEMMAYLLSLKPDLSHVNGYGGTLLSTIIHGSENCPERAHRDYLACARLALEEGVALPTTAIRFAGDENLSAFLADWAEAHPGQVVEGGAA